MSQESQEPTPAAAELEDAIASVAAGVGTRTGTDNDET